MKTILIAFLMMVSSGAVDLTAVRKNFEEAKGSKAATDNLYNSLHSYRETDPLLIGYKGASLTLKARYEQERSEKRAMVAQGIRTLEGAIKSAPNNIELRLIRLAVQENSPKILKYKMNMQEDKQLILAHYAAQTVEVKSIIKRYAKQSTFFTAEDGQKLTK
ncbi:hypothetical protein [Sphingobacterium deserti]|uniref:Uncharacterized protein n=1 Tax=Sphingobacterium deserti TaxID=1229276 RepID=A0A0B8T9W5_9SPHI|nr:hypothetical protein [Sphingobacterium deserti]KGE14835.1 hypothetical protein DI53_1335 [Sphingobacterium deserti]